jgi:toxin CptA
MRSSNASAPSRFELRPSRWAIGGVLALSVLAPLAVLASGMPRAFAWPLALLACAVGLWSARTEARRPARLLVVDGDGRATVDGIAAGDLRIDWRGPLAFVAWRDASGRRVRGSFWPDTLDTAGRRELRLAVDRIDAGRRAGRMAP